MKNEEIPDVYSTEYISLVIEYEARLSQHICTLITDVYAKLINMNPVLTINSNSDGFDSQFPEIIAELEAVSLSLLSDNTQYLKIINHGFQELIQVNNQG